MKKRVLPAALALTVLFGCTTGNNESSATEEKPRTETTAAVIEQDTTPQEETEYVHPEVPKHLSQDKEVLEKAGDGYYLLTDSRYPVYANTQVSYYPTGEDFYEALLEELKKAEKFIFMEYFIVSDGEMLDGLMEVLKERMDDGVEIRLICDGFKQNDAFAEKLNEFGIKCRLYREPERISLNRRDHRKLTVIDGRTAFMGGANIGDEYINLASPYGRWKDAAISMQGDAVRSCTELFFEQWENGSELDGCEEYLDLAQPVDAEGYVLPYGESPFDELNAAREIYLGLINEAQDHLYITAPYLNIDDEVENALCAAAERGAEVIMIVPGIPDKHYMELIARPHYKTLAKAGVKIYRFDPGFIHSKVFVCDGRAATVGSVNLNNRSFYCDYECGAVLTDTPCIADIEADILTTLEECTLLTADMISDLTPAEQTQASFFLNIGDMI